MAETRMLPVQLTPEDLRERGEELAAKLDHLLLHLVDPVLRRLGGLLPLVLEGVEQGHLDSGEVVESRPMTPRELEDVLQQRLGFAVHEGERKQG